MVHKWINTILLGIVAVTGLALMVLVAMPKATAQSVTPYIPRSIIVGPNATWFTITDESRGPAVRYVCAFTAPKYVKTNLDGTRLYVPTVQCNK